MKKKIFASALLMFCLFSNESFQQKDETLQDVFNNSGMKQIASSFYNNGWIDFKQDLKIDPKDIFVKYKNLFGLGNNDEMRLVETDYDKETGTEQYKYQQYYKGIKVEGMIFVIHSKNTIAYTANGQIAPSLNIEVDPKVSLNNAKYNAKNNQIILKNNGKFFINHDLKEDSLIIIQNPNILQRYSLNYRFKFIDTLTHQVYKVNLDMDGNVLNVENTSFQNLPLPNNTGSCSTLYNGIKSVYTYYHNANWPCPNYYHIGTDALGAFFFEAEEGFTEFPCLQPIPGYLWQSTNIWTSPDVKPYISAFWALQKAQTFFADLGFDHITNNQIVWYSTKNVFSHPNSSYNPDSHEFSFGGPIANECGDMVEIDIVGHEYAHGIISYICPNLLNTGETGALQEGLCDAFGAMIEDYSEGWNEDRVYTQGYSAIINPLYKRSLKNPNALGAHTTDQNCYFFELGQPDTYLGIYWDTRGCDAAGIHTNSTVISHWFYLLAEGGSGTNDFNEYYNVTGIGRTKATQIIYKYVRNQYLGYGSSFVDARIGTIKVACEEYGLCSNEYYQVMNAWNAVHVNNSYCGLDYARIINPPSQVCYPAGTTITLNCVPCSASITWSKSDNLSFVGGNTDSNVTVCPSSSTSTGSGWVYATLVSSSGTYQVPTITFSVGGISGVTVSGPTNVCKNRTYIYTAQVPGGHQSTYSYSWTYPSNWIYNYMSQNTISLTTPSSPYYGSIGVRVTNSCGTSPVAGLNVYGSSGCGGFYTIYPNPAIENITVTKVENSPSLLDTNSNEISNISNQYADVQVNYTIRIYTSQGNLISTFQRNGTSFEVPLINMRDGTYIIEINDGKIIDRQQLIVKHN